jgi:DNA-binding NtrC family response regulator
MGRSISKIEQSVYDTMLQYNFPGNIRELRNVVERAIILCNDQVLRNEHFSLNKSNTIIQNSFEDIYDLEEIEKRTIERALQKTDFNKSEAARLLNIEWNALHRRLLKYKM